MAAKQVLRERLKELLDEEAARSARVILDGPEKLVALLLIEPERLEFVGVEPGTNAAALAGGSFGTGQDARAEVLSSNCSGTTNSSTTSQS